MSEYHCEKCGAKGCYNDECARCLMRKDEQENREAYQVMGDVELANGDSTFDDGEVEVLQQALAMYAAYLRYAEGEPDSTAESMARDFYERRHGVRWEEDAARFANAHGRPMDLADVSPVDWYERSENIK